MGYVTGTLFMENVKSILLRKGPLTARELISELKANNDATARQQISRARDVLSTKPIKFSNGYIYYLNKHLKGDYQKKIKKHLPERPPLNRVYKTLLLNKGYITRGQMAKSSCAAPEEAQFITGRRATIDEMIKQLLTLNIIEPIQGRKNIYKSCYYFKTTDEKTFNSFLRILKLEQSLLEDFVKWIQNVYVVGNDSYSVRNSENEAVGFNSFCWDFQAAAYIGPCAASQGICPAKKQIDGFIVADVVTLRQYCLDDVESYLERVKTVNLKWKRIRIFPVVLARNFAPEALSKLRSYGIAPLTFKEVWGRNVEELLRIYSKIINGDVPDNMAEIEKALDLAKMSENEGLLGNIKGDLFEVMMGFAYSSDGYDVTFKKIINDEQGQEYEIDIVAKKGRTCLLIECKGRANMSEDEHLAEIEKHFKDRTKTATLPYGWNITKEYDNVEAIYITTSTEDCIPDSYKKAGKNYGIICTVIDKKGVENFLSKTNEELKNIIKKYYC
jgi:Holliday junction resolvase-like predicted endonuclease